MPRDLPCQARSIQSVLFHRGAGRGPSGGRACRAASVSLGLAVSGHSARFARSGKPGSGTGARFAPIATTRYASIATAPRSTVPARAGSGSGRPRPSCGPRLRRRISPAAACWTHDGSRTGSTCSTTCSARLASRRDRSSLTPLLTSDGPPSRWRRSVQRALRRARTATLSPPASVSIFMGGPRQPTDRPGNRRDQARAQAPSHWQLLRFRTTVEWAPWRRCNHA
jgi:hypothetical protein